ncbi:MAG: NADH-quinone oxidoreductase subunit J [Planctomycetota bacterium]|nr:MAG: NADH-quinone oxidoreductase subunit J [Planctomycetota bacterium]
MLRTSIMSLHVGTVLLCVTAMPALAHEEAASGVGTGVVYAVPGGWFEAVMFYVFAGTAVLSAIGVCVSRSVVRMATWLFFALGAISVLYFLLAATFIAAIQLIVYVGGVLILLIFGVMLTSQSPWVRFTPSRLNLAVAGVICAGLLVCLSSILLEADFGAPLATTPGVTVEAIGRRMLTHYLVPFEIAGVLLMIVMVGAAHLARQEKS